MSRKFLIQSLKNYGENHPEENSTVHKYLEFVQSNKNCFSRDLLQGHVTGSAWLVNQQGTHVLLTHHKKLDRWLQLGGHSDGNAHTPEVALREAVEESGINDLQIVSQEIFDIDIHTIPQYKSVPEHLHYDARYVIQTSTTEDYTVSGESKDLKWCEIQTLTDFVKEDSLLRMARRWLNQRTQFGF